MAIYSTSGTAPAAFAVAADFAVPFTPKSILIINEDPAIANYVEFSFDGSTVHGRLTPTIFNNIKVSQQAAGIWIRRGAGTPVVRIVVES